MPSYIGFVHCPGCGIKHLTDPSKVTVWFSADSYEQLTEAVCPGCENTIESRVSFETMVAFKQYNVRIRQFSERYELLTEELIDKWDIDSELGEYDFSK